MVLLANSKLKSKLLTYCFTHSDESFYVRELAGLVGEDAGNISRELRKLEAQGLYHSAVRGNLKIYTLNKQYSLFKELKGIVFKTEGVEGSLRSLVEECRSVILAFIYGSYAKGSEGKASDIDLILVGHVPVDKITRQIRGLEAKLNREINFTSYTPQEFEKQSQKAGSFLNLVLKGKIVIIKGQRNAG